MFKQEKKSYDLVVIGAGMSGIATAITAARQGLQVALIGDRPVLGGNASSEIRMWIRGAGRSFPHYKEGGLCEEIALDNAYYNPEMVYPLWDMVLLNKVQAEKNITLFMNTFCMNAKALNRKVQAITAVQMTTYTEITFEGKYFVDCTGDCVLADCIPISYMLGREDKASFHEKAGKDEKDTCTMGNSCLFALRETDHKVTFTPPPFAKKFTDKDFENRLDNDRKNGFIESNYWWIELGGERDSLHDAEEIKYELLATVYGVYDYVKNSGKYDADNYQLEFVGFYPGKRESRRYVGEYILTQNDIENCTKFPDEVAYGGWPMDDHPPLGMKNEGDANVNYFFEQPYGIPLRCLMSKDYDNVGFAGRNISVTHMALSSTRVMATCMAEGQAIAMAVSMANGALKDVIVKMSDLQQKLREADCYLLQTKRKISQVIQKATHTLSKEQYALLTNGIERDLGSKDTKSATFEVGEKIEFCFDEKYVKEVRLVFDSDLVRECQKTPNMKQYPNRFSVTKDSENAIVPPTLVKSFALEVCKKGKWEKIFAEENNYQRLRKVLIAEEISGVRFIGTKTHGDEKIKLYSIDVS